MATVGAVVVGVVVLGLLVVGFRRDARKYDAMSEQERIDEWDQSQF